VLQFISINFTMDNSAANVQTLVGMSLDDAKAKAQQMGLSVRVTSVDGKSSMVTMDYNENRVNFATESGVVTRAHLG
jgi:beta-lactam-binding protein with PASTA domain